MACESTDCTDVATSCADSKAETLGTTSANALACNSSTIDLVVNSTDVVINRLGNQLNTLTQLESNYTITAINDGIWDTGQIFTGFNQFMVFSGTAYKPKVTTTLPFIVGATPDLDFVEPVTVITISSVSFDMISSVLTADLVDAKIITTEDGIFSGDNFGGIFGATGFTVIGNAGTVDVNTAKVYDVNGVEFKLIGQEVRLETLNVPYSETDTIVLGYIITLRQAAFIPNISPKYDVFFPTFGSDAFTTDWETSIHRGLATHFPENTLLSFTGAQKTTNPVNKTFWEADVQISSDNVAVLIHDQTIDDLTDGTGTVTSLTFAQLQAVKFDRTIGTIYEEGVRIPTLEDIIKAAAARGVKLELEMKNYGVLTTAKFKIMTDLVKKYKMSNSVTYSSFFIADLITIKGLDNQCGLSLASNTPLANIVDLETLRKLSLGSNRQPVLSKSLSDWLADPTDVAVCHSFGVSCIGFTSDKGKEIVNMSEIGIHKLHTNSNIR